MPYNRFTFSEAKGRLQLQTDETVDLFADVTEVKISNFLAQFLEENVPLALAVNTEKSKSEIIIAPILLELRKLADRPISIFSGVAFNVDKEKGLTGTCDFIISRSSEQYFITAPVLTVAEAKKDNIHNGLGQCIAENVCREAIQRTRKERCGPCLRCCYNRQHLEVSEVGGWNSLH